MYFHMKETCIQKKLIAVNDGKYVSYYFSLGNCKTSYHLQPEYAHQVQPQACNSIFECAYGALGNWSFIKANWEVYASDTDRQMTGHLIETLVLVHIYMQLQVYFYESCHCIIESQAWKWYEIWVVNKLARFCRDLLKTCGAL